MDIIRTDTDYAIRGLMHLAQADEEIVSCSEVASACGIPKSFAHKILKRMADSGILESIVGRGGGFRLAKSPDGIGLNEVVGSVQGPVVVRECVLRASACERSDECLLSEKWEEIQRSIVDFLNHTTLADLLTAYAPSSDGG